MSSVMSRTAGGGCCDGCSNGFGMDTLLVSAGTTAALAIGAEDTGLATGIGTIGRTGIGCVAGAGESTRMCAGGGGASGRGAAVGSGGVLGTDRMKAGTGDSMPGSGSGAGDEPDVAAAADINDARSSVAVGLGSGTTGLGARGLGAAGIRLTIGA